MLIVTAVLVAVALQWAQLLVLYNISPTAIWLLALVAFLVASRQPHHRSSVLRTALAIHFTIFTIFAIGLLRSLSVPYRYGPFITATACLIGYWAVVRMTPRKAFVGIAVLSLVTGYVAISFKHLNEPVHEITKLQQAGVTPIPVFAESEWQSRGDLRFVLGDPTEPRYLVGSRGGPRPGAYFWYPDNQRIELPVVGAGDNAVIDADHDAFIVPDHLGNAVVIGRLSDPRHPTVIAMSPYEKGSFDKPRIVVPDWKRDRILLIDESDTLWSVPTHWGVPQPIYSIHCYGTWVNLDVEKDQIIFGGSEVVHVLDAQTLQLRQVIPVSESLYSTQVFDPVHRRLFRMNTVQGLLELIDIDRGAIVKEQRLGFGFYYGAYDATRDLLLVSDYAHGDLVELRDLEPVRRRFVGHRTRSMDLDPVCGVVRLASAAGAFEVRL